jgi:low temperature requirement protein LtrA
VISVAQGAANVDWTTATVAAAVGGFVIVVCLWWLYFDRLDDGAIRSVLQGLSWNYAHLPLLAGLVSVAVGTEFAIREAATGQLERATTLTLGGGTAVYLLSTVVIGLAVRSSPDRMLWLWLASAAVALAVGLVWPLGLPVGLLVALDLVLLVLVAVDSAERRQAEPAAGASPL